MNCGVNAGSQSSSTRVHPVKMKFFLVSVIFLAFNFYASCASRVEDANFSRPQLRNRLQGKEIRVVAGHVRMLPRIKTVI